MTRFAVRQHDPLRTATGRRHHLNLLLHDHDQENARTYGDRAPGLLSVTKLRYQASPVSGSCADSCCKSSLATASVDSHVDSPASSPEQSSTSTSFRYAQQLPSVTEQALALSGSVWPQDSLLSSTALDRAPCYSTETFAAEASILDSSKSATQPSWLTPQQLQNRQLGMKVAKMMSSHRTPIGAFANFDMPVAP
ncbi:hypothetical protein WJX77_002065 [Trebouxia sp. C0004]